MNIAICNSLKLYFNDKKWNNYGGGSDFLGFLLVLTRYLPKVNFYLLGTNDFDELLIEQREILFPNRNVVNLRKGLKGNLSIQDFQNYYIHTYPDLHFDLIIDGMLLSNNINTREYLKKEDGSFYKPMGSSFSQNSSSIFYINFHKSKYLHFFNDGRNKIKAKDLQVAPFKTYSQINESYVFKHYDENQKYVEENIEVEYKSIEMCSMIGLEKRNFDDLFKNKFKRNSICINENTKDQTNLSGRYKILEEYILPAENAEIFGQWRLIDSNERKEFKGPLHRFEVHKEMEKWLCGLCVPITEGWATSKYLEYIYNGVFPIYHCFYDIQNNTKIRDLCLVNNKDEYKDIINKDMNFYYENTKKLFTSFINDDIINGKIIIEIFLKDFPEFQDFYVYNKSLSGVWKSSKKTENSQIDFL